MNRASKWYQSTKENKRPRQQCYQPLLSDEDLEHESREFGYGSNSDIKLASICPDLYVEKILETGDTLQTLSLQFNCPVAELKRINHILRDNEIYARRKIKVPVKPGSVITEKLARVHSNGHKNEGINESAKVASSTDEETDITTLNSNPLLPKQFSQQSFNLNNYSQCETLLNSKSSPSTSTSVTGENALLDIEEIIDSTLPKNLSDEQTNTSNENIPFKCNGADWGLSWLQLVVCALLVGIGGPLFYILYITEKKHSN